MYFLIVLVIYAYVAFCIYKIAARLNSDKAWWAWVPVLNVVLLIMLAGKPWPLVFLFFIPIVGAVAALVVGLIVWYEIAGKVGKPNWIGVLMVVPFVNFVVMGYLALSE